MVSGCIWANALTPHSLTSIVSAAVGSRWEVVVGCELEESNNTAHLNCWKGKNVYCSCYIVDLVDFVPLSCTGSECPT